jgi:ATP-dependent Zn protease
MLGAASPLHIIVFDEFDALVKQRGSSSGGSSNLNLIQMQVI